MIGFLKNNLIILIIILILFSYLGIKALDENGWDGWGFGSAQVLMSSQYWAKDGLAKNYFLFIPRPYSKLIHYLDEPEFRNRPIDTSNGELARDRRLYYTHYPPLFLVPFAILAKIGITDRSVFRILALIISLCGLGFFYWFIKLISNKTIAVIATLYYGFSVTFLNYADSSANQPFTIFFTFLILLLSIQAWQSFNIPEKYKKYNLYIWLAYLALSLSSYDATFYIFAYLVLFDVFILKKFLWKKWLIFASAPVLGFTLQVIQNTWYLGWQNMANDFYRYYTERAIGNAKNFIIGITAPFISMTGIKTFYFFKKTVVALGSAGLSIWILWILRKKIDLNPIFFRMLIILAFAAIAQPFFLNVTGWWPYQGVLTAVFWGLLIGTSSTLVLEIFKQKKLLELKEKFLFGLLILTAAALWTYQFSNTWRYVKSWPNNKPDQKVIEFSKKIQSIQPGKEKIAFRIYPKNPIWKSQFPTFNMEYYIGMLTINFANTKDLLTDFEWLRNRSKYPFYSFVISENKSDVEKIRQELTAKNLKNISPIMNIQDQYLFTIGPK
ncbi:MAG: hypothetical protein NTV77_03200 [Candidatus Azambacteria bacterium]|nr:hypothetical protein [Candidatus Azambacteria bacterium]